MFAEVEAVKVLRCRLMSDACSFAAKITMRWAYCILVSHATL